MNPLKAVDGWKSYIVGAAIILYGVAVDGWQNGDWAAAQEKILAGLAVIGLRHAIAKAMPPKK